MSAGTSRHVKPARVGEPAVRGPSAAMGVGAMLLGGVRLGWVGETPLPPTTQDDKRTARRSLRSTQSPGPTVRMGS